jgi:hypothetical protein
MSAELLGVSPSHVLAVSAQKGLVAKVTDDAALLEASRLPLLELALAEGVMGQRQGVLRSVVTAGISELRTEAGRSLHIRRRDLAELMTELRSLRGKNAAVVQRMRIRIEREQAEFDSSGARIHAVRSVHLKLLRDVFNLLGAPALRAELAGLTHKLKQPGIKLGLKAVYGDTFSRLVDNLRQAQALSSDIQAMLTASFRDLNAEFSFSLQAPKVPELVRHENDLKTVERSHLQYLGVHNVLKLTQPEFTERLVRALGTRLRVVYESALGEVELWNKSAAAQLDAQLRERRRNFSRRLDAIERIREAASGLDERMAEIIEQEVAVEALDRTLGELTGCLVDGPETGRDKATAHLVFQSVAAAPVSERGGNPGDGIEIRVDINVAVDTKVKANNDADVGIPFSVGQGDTTRQPLVAS